MTWRIPIHDDDSGEVIETRTLCERCVLTEFGSPIRLLDHVDLTGFLSETDLTGAIATDEPCYGAPCREELHETLPTAWDRVSGEDES